MRILKKFPGPSCNLLLSGELKEAFCTSEKQLRVLAARESL